MYSLSNDLKIRELLNPVSTSLEHSVITNNATTMVEGILKSKHTIERYHETQHTLIQIYDSLKGIFDYANVPLELRQRQFLNKTGFAMSPKDAITTIQDVFRVSGFIRAIDQAIQDLRTVYKDTPLHIVYPACGPLAPLLVPLLAYYNAKDIYSANELQVTFIDIQEGAIIALIELLKVARLGEFVKDVCLMDAVEYQSDETIHMVILEAMQHGFSKEGHLSIARHFAARLDSQGLFLPQEVRIDAVLAKGEEEYTKQWQEKFSAFANSNQEILNRRMVLGRVLNVNLETLQNMEVLELDEYTHLLKCASFTIPAFKQGEQQTIMLFTTNITIYKDEEINEYDSGITHPLPDLDICINFIPKTKKENDLYLVSGDSITFYYKLVGLPGFLVTKDAP